MSLYRRLSLLFFWRQHSSQPLFAGFGKCWPRFFFFSNLVVRPGQTGELHCKTDAVDVNLVTFRKVTIHLARFPPLTTNVLHCRYLIYSNQASAAVWTVFMPYRCSRYSFSLSGALCKSGLRYLSSPDVKFKKNKKTLNASGVLFEVVHTRLVVAYILILQIGSCLGTRPQACPPVGKVTLFTR